MARTNNSIDKLYDDHKHLIYALAHQMSRQTGHEVDRLIAQGNYCFMEAARSWPRKQKFSTWLYRALFNDLRNFARKNERLVLDNEGSQAIPSHYSADPARVAMFRDALANLSEEARVVVGIVLDGPEEVLGWVAHRSPRAIRGLLKEHLREQGWSWPVIWRTFREIKELLYA